LTTRRLAGSTFSFVQSAKIAPLSLEAFDDGECGFGRVRDVADDGPMRRVAPKHRAVQARLGERLFYGGVEDGRAEA
jgi:hypothetical protein